MEEEEASFFYQAVEGGNEGEVTRLLDGDATLLERPDEGGMSPLMVAAMQGQLGVVKLLRQRGASMNATSIAGNTALHWAARVGHKDVVAWLIGQGAHAIRRETDGVTPFMLACQERHLGVARLLLQHTGNEALQEANNRGWTALHYAASWADEETVTSLLEQGAQASSRDNDGNTPLMYACDWGQLGVSKVLLQHVGAQALQETDNEGFTALHRAAMRGHEEVVSFVIGKGAQANSRDSRGMTPLLCACRGGHVGVVRVLLQHAGREALHETDNDGFTALHCAAYGGCKDMATFLLEQGVQANSRDEDGNTPLMLACGKRQLGVIKVLLEHVGAEALQERDHEGYTALHRAALCGREDVVAFLISKGAQGSSRGPCGMTPLLWACRWGRLGVVRLLVQHMGPPALQDADVKGMTALHRAVEKGHVQVVRFLLFAGADPTVTDNEGRTPRAIADEEEEEEEETRRRAACVPVFEWYACELERRRVLHRATCLRKACTTQRHMPTSQVPTYLTARVAAGHALPHVEVMMPQPHGQQEECAVEELADGSGKRKAGGERDGPQGADAGESEEEGHAVL